MRRVRFLCCHHCPEWLLWQVGGAALQATQNGSDSNFTLCHACHSAPPDAVPLLWPCCLPASLLLWTSAVGMTAQSLPRQQIQRNDSRSSWQKLLFIQPWESLVGAFLLQKAHTEPCQVRGETKIYPKAGNLRINLGGFRNQVCRLAGAEAGLSTRRRALVLDVTGPCTKRCRET